LNRLLSELENKLTYSEYDLCVRTLDKFLKDKKDKREAAEFFLMAYDYRLDEVEADVRDVERHNLSITARLWALSTSAAGVFGGLISFMILPLLIRIEANTRSPLITQPRSTQSH